MILSDRDIREYIKQGRLSFDPLPDLDKQLSGASLDMTLANEFRVFQHSTTPYIDINRPETFTDITKKIVVPDGCPFILHPNEFILGIIQESIKLPKDLSVRIDGKSSLGRLGIVVHSTAGHVNPGHEGALTLEISNIGMMPVTLYPGMNICQLVFQRLTSPAVVGYTERKSSKYAFQRSPGESKIFTENRKKKQDRKCSPRKKTTTRQKNKK
jgi:dCTP deaminase